MRVWCHVHAKMRVGGKFWLFLDGLLVIFAVSYLVLFAFKVAQTSTMVDAFNGCKGLGIAHIEPLLRSFALNNCSADGSQGYDADGWIVSARLSSAFIDSLANMPIAMLQDYVQTVLDADLSAQVYLGIDELGVWMATLTMYVLTFRLLRFMHLQPRLAIVTRTLFTAADDLAYFGFVFIFYA